MVFSIYQNVVQIPGLNLLRYMMIESPPTPLEFQWNCIIIAN